MGYSWFALAFSLVTLTLYVISNYFTKPVHVPDNDMKGECAYTLIMLMYVAAAVGL